MKSFNLAALVAILPVFAMATSIRPLSPVAPKLVTLKVLEVGLTGRVEKQTHNHPTTNFLISIPAEVALPDACTKFVGQEDVLTDGDEPQMEITVKGTRNPLLDACRAIAVAPVKTNLTFNFPVMTGGFMPTERVVTRIMHIAGLGQFSVVLDMRSRSVKIEPDQN